MAITDLSKSEAVQRLQRTQAQIRNIKKEAAEVAGRTVDSVVGVAGGVASGVIRGYNEDGTAINLPGTEVPLDLILSGAFIAVGVTGMAGEASRPLGALGTGMGAAAAGFHTREMIQKARREGKL